VFFPGSTARLPFDGSRSFSTSVDDTLRPSQFTYERIRINAGYFPLAYSHGQNCLVQENCKPKPVHVEAPLQHVCRYPGYPSRLIWIGGGRRWPIFGKRKYISWTKRRQRSSPSIGNLPSSSALFLFGFRKDARLGQTSVLDKLPV
jgi:hypothetical protein